MSHYRLVFKSLNEKGVRYIVIGGIASISHGAQRTTKDLDIFIEPTEENARLALEALQDAGMRSAFGIDERRVIENRVTIMRDRYDIDLHTATPGLDVPDAFDRVMIVDDYGVSVPIASLDDLLSMKTAAGRPQDLRDIEELKEIYR